MITPTKSQLSTIRMFGKVQSYSGRGMYGKECLGIITDQPLRTHGSILLGIRDMENEDDADLIDSMERTVNSDSMGMSSILYYPNVAFPKDSDDDEEDDDDDDGEHFFN